MKMIFIKTDRLELIPITVDLCTADLTSSALLSEGLNARVPDAWPPALVTRETLNEFITLLINPGESRLYAFYWVKTGDSPDDRILVGSGGFVRDEDGTLELGYSVLDEFQRQGYATEAVSAMIAWAKTNLGIPFIKACTYPDLIGSINVLEKNGFSFVGKGREEGTIAYCLTF